MRTPSRVLLVLVALVAPACPLFGTGGAQEAPAAAGGRWGTFVQVSDSDEVTDIAASGSDVWIGTTRGLLRYASTGGAATRIGRSEGLPADVVRALAPDPRGVWVATDGALSRFDGTTWQGAGGGLPEIGAITGVAYEDATHVWVGGTRGIARFVGTGWLRYSDRHNVTNLALSDGGLWIATRQSGVAFLTEGRFSEFGVSAGLPDLYARAVAPLPGGKAWVLTSGRGGVALNYYDGSRWATYTAPGLTTPILDLVLVEGAPALVVAEGLLYIRTGGGGADGTVRLKPTSVGPADSARRVSVTPAVAPPAVVGSAPERPQGVPPRPFYAPEQSDTPDAPAFHLAIVRLGLGAPIRGARAQEGSLYVAVAGLGVARWSSGSLTEYRTRDLEPGDGPFAVATDAQSGTWIAGQSGIVGRFDGTSVRPFALDSDPRTDPVAVTQTGNRVFALARVRGTESVRVYQLEGSTWRAVVERVLSVPGGLNDLTLFGVDARNRFWVGIKVSGPTVHERGFAVFDAQAPQVTYYHANASEPGTLRLPDSVTAMVQAEGGQIWLASIQGAVHIADGNVQIFGESRGVRGEIVSDLAVGAGGRLYVAAGEGVAWYENEGWRFFQDEALRRLHPTTLAVDPEGKVFFAGERGVLVYDGTTFRPITHADGLLSEHVRSVRTDGEGRVWFATDRGLSVLLQRRR